MPYFVYILASRPGGALQTGATGDLRHRLAQHRDGRTDPHSAKYNITTLVWFETHDSWAEALARERKLKRWRRAWKIDLIMADNPDWRDIGHRLPD